MFCIDSEYESSIERHVTLPKSASGWQPEGRVISLLSINTMLVMRKHEATSWIKLVYRSVMKMILK